MQDQLKASDVLVEFLNVSSIRHGANSQQHLLVKSAFRCMFAAVLINISLMQNVNGIVEERSLTRALLMQPRSSMFMLHCRIGFAGDVALNI